MGRLRAIGSRLTAAPMRIAQVAAVERDEVLPWRRWYKTKKWQRMRWRVLVRDGFTCRRCGRVDPSPKLVADHVQPHRGNADLFWDEGNLQCLCKPCHDGAKQAAERRGW